MAEAEKPLTEAEEAKLEELSQRKALAAWADQEEARKAKLTSLAPLKKAFPEKTVTEMRAAIEELIQTTTDFDVRSRAQRIQTIFLTDVEALMQRIKEVETETPKPGAMSTS